MTNIDLPSNLYREQSVCEEVKLMLVNNDTEMSDKLDIMLMVIVLHGLHKDLEFVQNQTLTNPNIPTVEELIDCLLRVPSPKASCGADSQAASESLILASNSTDHGGQGHGRGRGRGGRGNLHCTYCKQDGHTLDRCYSLHGFPTKTAIVAQYRDRWLSKRPSLRKIICSPLVSIRSTFSLRRLNKPPLLRPSLLTLDRNTRKTIGIGSKSRGDLHYLQPSASTICVV